MRDIQIEIGSKWRHFKGNIIEVKTLAKHTEDLTDLVIYEHDGKMWARPISMFLSNEDISGRTDNVTKQKFRFEKL